jgi:ABC-2 type transport system ATP-binding protein
MSEALQVRCLKKTFSSGLRSRKQVLNQVEFTVKAGTITGFVGVNGSGKTTTIKCLLNFVFPDSDPTTQISFFGDTKFTTHTRSRIGYLPERPYLPERLSAKEFLRLHWQLSGQTGNFNERCQQVLQRVNLVNVEDRLLRQFSKGMLQRMGLAQALLHQADFLILDEPMSGLDPDGRWLVKEIIREENKRGATVFFSSHLLGDMDELCSHLVVIDQGQTHFSGLVEDFIREENKTVMVTYLDRQKNRVQSPSGQNELQNKIKTVLAEGGEILRIHPVESSIESVFAKKAWLK